MLEILKLFHDSGVVCFFAVKLYLLSGLLLLIICLSNGSLREDNNKKRHTFFLKIFASTIIGKKKGLASQRQMKRNR